MIGEVLVYSGTLTTAQQAEVNAYLDAKWLGVGTPAATTPPRDHPGQPHHHRRGLEPRLRQPEPRRIERRGRAAALSSAAGAGGMLTIGSDNNSTTFAGTISGDGGLTKAARASSPFPGRTATRATTVNGGTLQIGNGGSGEYLASPSVTMSNNATVAFNHADPLSYGGAISGSGQLIKLGTGVARPQRHEHVQRSDDDLRGNGGTRRQRRTICRRRRP